MPADPRVPLEHWGLAAAPAAPHGDPGRNQTWRVHLPDGTAFLTRFGFDQSLDGVRWQCEAMASFRAAGWPAPEALADPALLDGHIWLLMRGLPGDHPAQNFDQLDEGEKREVGRLIARVQASTGHLMHDVGQRPGAARCDEIKHLQPTVDEVLARWEPRLPEEVALLRGRWERAQEAFEEHRSSRLPSSLIHGDITPWNLLCVNGTLIGLLDFEFAHLDLRIADLVHSWRGRHDDVVVGYLEEIDLTDDERALIAPVRWAWLLGGIRNELLRAGDGKPYLDWFLNQAARRSSFTDG